MRGRRELSSLTGGAAARGPWNGRKDAEFPRTPLRRLAASGQPSLPAPAFGSHDSSAAREEIIEKWREIPLLPPRPASAHTNLFPCGAGGECSNRRRAGQRSQSIGSEELPFCALVLPPSPTA